MLRDSVKLEGPGCKYLIKHTTGSGKSYSIGWLAHLLASLFRGKDETNRMLFNNSSHRSKFSTNNFKI